MLRHPSTYLLLSLALVLAMSSFASAQRGGFGGGRDGGSLSGLLRSDEVLKEIEVTDEQKTELTKVLEESRGQRPEGGRNFRDLSEEERTKLFAEMREAAAKRNAELKEKLGKVLLEPQMKRLNELSIQRRGVSALSDAEVATALKLTDMQKETLASTIAKNGEKMRELFQGAGENRDGLREKIDALRKESDEAVLGVLSDEQKKQFEEMKGEAFTFPQRERGQGRRGGERPDA
jgi:Spy/CpxP family protein refolding chaperone